MLNADLPFFDDPHRRLARDLDAWCRAHLPTDEPPDVDTRCRELVRLLGEGGWLRYCVPARFGGAPMAENRGDGQSLAQGEEGRVPPSEQVDTRALCLIRATLAYHSGLADFVFAMQGLGSGAITLAGSPEIQARYLPDVAAGRLIAAFALSEPEAGSDAAALTTRAIRDGDEYVLDGTKTWISNGGIADFYVVFARSEADPGARGISAFVVPADTPGLRIAERIEVIAPHPLATLALESCRIPADHMLGVAGEGFKLAMRTLDGFRASVAGAAVGLARRALDEAVRHARGRRLFGQTLGDLQMTQARLATMDAALEAAALLTAQAAWLRAVRGVPATREVAIAKMQATESAQAIIDGAVQLFGARGVRRGEVVERLYREIRALRIYEGATEVQQVIIARSILKEDAQR